MLRTLCRQLDGQSVWLWLFDEADESFALRLAVEGDTVVPPDSHPFVRDPTLWKQNQVLEDVLFTGAPTIFEDIQTDPRMPVAYREYLKRIGAKKGVGVPILAGGKVKGVITIRHGDRPPYRREEIELMQALAHQVMLALRLTQLAEQSRRAAILEERNRMARDIHDTLAQGFTGVIIKSMTVGTALHPSFKVQGKVDELPPIWQENLLHIGQEALANTIKYAHAHKFGTRLMYDSKELRLEFSDDGDGFKPQDRHDGRGLFGMRERIEQMGGELKITSARGKGTKITVVLPCNGESML
jgi:signal transduction histidine kinase